MNLFTYRIAYGLGIILFVASLLNPLTEGFYILTFFACSVTLIISWQKVPQDITHSTVTHYERYSRWNWFNYGMSAWLVLSALMLLLPVPKSIIIFALWTLTVLGLPFAIRFYQRSELGMLLTDYAKQQMPDMEVSVIKGLIAKMLGEPGYSNKKLAKLFATDESQVVKLRHYVEVYVLNNRK